VDAWRALLASMARRAPVVALVEDLHWADPTMLDVLDELAERLDGPLVFLCTARPDLLRSRPDWGGGRRSFSSVPLDPLSSDESAQLVSFLPGVEALPDGVRRLILERSGGNPFFLEEIVRHLINDGRLVWDGVLARLARVDELHEALQTLRRREFVLERVSSSFAGQREFAFKHVLIRDVAYASLPRAERGHAHAETAAWIEE